mmetsp:Transcript_55514/g.180056  ORF Transcript_55514/g.180056 Transcript_55514/m.180056 type:complete len:1021 (+) Transcript_55514:125-3187(+)
MEWLVGPLAGGLFDYNRENFFFDWEQRLKREFQGQNMRVKQFSLYREDVRDLMGLTVSKMDNYLVVNAFTLGICIMLFTMGRPESGKSAQWVLWLGSMTTASALFYTLMSMWLAMHASIAAHSFGVRMLTQAVRLPIPSKAQLDEACAVARDYESRSLGDMLRIPVVAQQMRRLAEMDNTVQRNAPVVEAQGSSDDEASSDAGSDTNNGVTAPPVAAASALKHLKLYRQLQGNWQAYDAYARVSMAMGANQLLHAVSYFCVRMLASEQRSAWPALCCLCILVFAAWLLASLDLYLAPRVLAVAGTLLLLPPVFTMVGIIIAQSDHAKENELLSDICAPASFLLHIAWSYFFWHVARPTEFNGVALPTNFRSVLYLDVFGWLKAPATPNPDQQHVATDHQLEHSTGSGVPTAGSGTTLPVVAEDAELRGISVKRRESVDRARAAQDLRAQLLRLCQGMQIEIKRVLGYWEHDAVQSMITADPVMGREIKSLRRCFDAVASKLEAGECHQDIAAPAELPIDQPAVWLQLEWNTSGVPIPFWYRCETGASVWTFPQPPDLVSTLAIVDSQVKSFDQKVQELDDFQVPEPEMLAVGAPTDAASSGVERAVSVDTSRSALCTDPEFRGIPATQEEESAAQEMRFGGAEAVPLDDGNSLTMAFVTAGGDTFHPHGRRRASTATNGSRRRRRRPKIVQGKLPWQTFSQGSLYMIGVWTIGLFWCTYRVLDHSIDIVVMQQAVMSSLLQTVPESRVEIIFNGPWPHAFFKPQDIACGGIDSDRSAQNALLVSEEFGVHHLRLQQDDILDDRGKSTGTWLPARVLSTCLSQVPDFHAAGIRGIASLCPAASHSSIGKLQQPCAIALLNMAGNSILRCDNSSGSVKASQFAFHGGPWRSIGAQGTELIGMRQTDGSLISFREQPRGAAGLMPAFELRKPGRDGHLAKVVLLDQRVLLSLNDGGLLRVARLQTSTTEHLLWSRQLPANTRWGSMCFVNQERAIYLVGSRVRSERPVIARLRLPFDILEETF